MPFRNFRRKRYSRRYKKKPMKWVASKRYVRTQLAKENEMKYFDTNDAFAVSDVSTIRQLSNIAQGTTDTSRVGDEVAMKFLRFKYTVKTEGDRYNLLRVIVFQWYTHSTYRVPTIAEILQSTANSYAIHSPYIHDYRHSFGVLYDKVHRMVYDADNEAMIVNKKVPLKYAKKNIHFEAGTTDGANKLYLLVVSDSAAVNHPSILYYTRLWYTDS